MSSGLRAWGIALLFSAFLLLAFTSWGHPPRWNGLVYQNALQQLLEHGLHPTQVDPRAFPDFAKGQWGEGYVQVCIAWLMGTGLFFHTLGQLLGIGPTPLALSIELVLGLSLFGWALNRLMRVHFQVEEGLAILGMCASLALIPITIMFPVRMHPEPWVLLWSVLMVHAAWSNQRILYGIYLFLGLLTKQSILPVVGILVAGDLWTRSRSAREQWQWIGVSGVVLVAWQVVMHQIAWPSEWRSHGVLFGQAMLEMNHQLNAGKNWDYFLRNFDVLWVPFAIGIFTASHRIRVYAFLSLAVSLALLVIASDWWRNLYASLVWLVVPVGVQWMQQEIWPKLSMQERALFSGGVLLAVTRPFDIFRLQSLGLSFWAIALFFFWVLVRQDVRLRS